MPQAAVSEVTPEAAPVVKAAPEPVDEPSSVKDEEDVERSEEFVGEEPAPSAEEMAAYLGAAGSVSETEESVETDGGSLPTLEEAAAMVPAKAKALMEELFRARLEKVKRINPKDIR